MAIKIPKNESIIAHHINKILNRKSMDESFIQKIISETLKNPNNGQWSRKNLTCFICILFAMVYSSYGMIAEKEVKEFVVIAFLSVATGLLGLSSWEKKNL